eukprot:6181329-Pleurochrysis_carterae.AAC.1
MMPQITISKPEVEYSLLHSITVYGIQAQTFSGAKNGARMCGLLTALAPLSFAAAACSILEHRGDPIFSRCQRASCRRGSRMAANISTYFECGTVGTSPPQVFHGNCRALPCARARMLPPCQLQRELFYGQFSGFRAALLKPGGQKAPLHRDPLLMVDRLSQAARALEAVEASGVEQRDERRFVEKVGARAVLQRGEKTFACGRLPSSLSLLHFLRSPNPFPGSACVHVSTCLCVCSYARVIIPVCQSWHARQR